MSNIGIIILGAVTVLSLLTIGLLCAVTFGLMLYEAYLLFKGK